MFISSDKKQMERGQVPVSVISQRAIKYSLIQDVLTSFLQGIVMSSTVILHWERRQGFRKASLTSLQNNCEQFPEYLIAFLCSSFFGPPRTAVAAFFFFLLITYFLFGTLMLPSFKLPSYFSSFLERFGNNDFPQVSTCYNLANGHSRKILKSKIFILLESNFFFLIL